MQTLRRPTRHGRERKLRASARWPDGKAVGRQMLQELLPSSAGMKYVVNNTPYPPREIVAEIRNRNAHAVLWHPTKRRYYFASEFPKEAAQTLLKGSR